MRKITLIGFLTLVFTILFSPVILAQNKPETGIKLPEFMAGNNQVIDKPVDRDLMVSGGQIKITSSVNGDVYVAGGQIDIGGIISGNLIVAGGNVTISGKIGKNVIVAGGQIKIDSPAEINGYVLAAGGKVDLLGHFLGPVKVGTGELTVGEQAMIVGDLEADVSKSNISLSSVITGEKKIQIHETKVSEKQSSQVKQLGYIGKVVSFLGKLLILLIFIKLFGQKIKPINTDKSFWSIIGGGLVVLIVTPILDLILMATVIAIPLSLMISGLYLVSLYLSGIVVSILMGNFMSEKKYLKTNNYYLQGSVGLIILTLVELIPLVSGLVKFIVLLVGMGIIFNKLQIYFSTK